MSWDSKGLLRSAVPAAFLASILLCSGIPHKARAQDASSTAPAAPAPAAADTRFTQEELRKLLAPYALYPDDLLAQLLPSCAYPIEIVQSARWLDKNKDAVAKGDFSGLDNQTWQPSVIALTRFPQVIAKLNEDLDATTDLGDAFVNQPEDVADTIQALRSEAQKSGALTSTPQQRVTVEAQGGTDYIVIEPTEPGVIYVPSYDPAVVYEPGASALASGVIGFGLGVAVGAVVDNAWDWGRGWVYPPRWPGYPGYRPGYPGRPGGGNINIGNDINIGNGNGNTRPWRPDADRYRPGQGSKPGLAKPGNRPGNRPGAGSRPEGGAIDRPGAGNRPGGGLAGGPGAGDRPGAGNRPGGGPGDRPNIGGGPGRPDVGRPGGPERPAAGRPGGAARPSASPARPAARPAPAQRPRAASRPASRGPARPNAFRDVRAGRGAHGYAQRGSVSRQSVARPPMRGGGGRHGGGGRRGGGGHRR